MITIILILTGGAYYQW